MGLDLVKALKAPAYAQNWIVKLIIGAILLCIPLANFITLGYLVRALQNFMNKEDKLPEYNDLGTLFVVGIKLFVGSIVFAVPFAIVIFILMMLFSKSGALVSVLVGIVELAAGFLGIVMLASFAVDEKILSMVNFPRVMKFFKENSSDTVSLIINMIIMYVIYIAVLIAACLLVVTIILIPFIVYAFIIAVYNLVGQFAANAPKLSEIKAEAESMK